MDVIQAILKDYEKNKIDADQLQDQLAAALKPDIASEADLNQQVEILQTQFALPQQTWDGVKTIVVDSLLPESTKLQAKTPAKSVTTPVDRVSAETIVHVSDKTRVIHNPSLDYSAKQSPTKKSADNGASTEKGNSPENVETIVNYSNDDNDKTIIRTNINNHTNSNNSATIVNTDLENTDRKNKPDYAAETIIADHVAGQANHTPPKELSGKQNSTFSGTRQEHTNNYFETNRFQTNTVELKPGSILKNRFILENELGHGGMSIVYRALDLRKQEANNRNPYIAIKILGAAFKNHPQSIRVLEHESQKIQSLAHPNIITVYDFDRDGDAIYMTMECLEGKSLDVLIHENRSGVSIEKALPIIQSMGLALVYAHSKNIIHSDLKPENVFITKDNVIKVLDFGIARAKKMPNQPDQKDENGNTYTDFDGSNLGALTPPYASPEMFDDADPDPRNDIYALGCVTYKLLTGRHPFDGKQSNHARDEGLAPQKINDLSRKQWNMLAKSLAFDREARVSTIAEFLDGLIPKKRTFWFYAGIAGTSLAIVISAYSWYSASQKPVLPQINLTVEQKTKISDYFETADLYFSMGYFASPPGDSAFDQYQKILAIDPTNQAAIEGKKKIANQYKILAIQKLNVNNIEESLLLVKTGLIVEPENEDLLDLQLEIHNKQSQ